MPTIHNGDCIETMNAMPPESVDAIVTDPPYGLGFMGKKWDGLPPSLEWAEACYRVLKPGGHIAAFGGTRTWHRLAVAIEDAGFEMRDSLAWLYGSGFPKSHDVSKAIDKQRTEDLEPAAEVARFLVQHMETRGVTRSDVNVHFGHSTAGSGAAQQWTTTRTDRAIKPRVPKWEQWQNLREWLDMPADMDDTVWRLNGNKGKPGENYENREVLSTREVQDIRNGHGRAYGGAMYAGEVTGKIEHKTTAPATEAAKRWQGWGTALKPAFEPIVLARKPLAEKTVARNVLAHGTGAINVDACRIGTTVETWPKSRMYGGKSAVSFTSSAETISAQSTGSAPAGRWPANVLLDQHAAAWVDEQSGDRKSGWRDADVPNSPDSVTGNFGAGKVTGAHYSDEGGASRFFYSAKAPKSERPNVDGVQHPTVKPLAIMRWLIRLVTPPGGVVLDPFAGSGTTIEAALIEGFNPVGIEMEPDYLPLIQHRIDRQAETLTA